MMIPDGANSVPEHVVERILRVEKVRRRRGWIHRALVKWKGFAEPTWENRSDLEKLEALDIFDKKFGKSNDVGEDEGARQGRRIKNNNIKQ